MDIIQCPRVLELFDKVFGIELLREKILDFVIHDEGGVLSLQDACSCRLVKKEWLATVTKCLINRGEPLFKFSLYDASLREFLKFYELSNRILKNVPPFKLIGNFGCQPFKKIRRLFKQYDSPYNAGLVQMDLQIVLDSPLLINLLLTFLKVCRRLQYPVLSYLDVAFCSCEPSKDHKNNDTIVASIQYILNNCNRLTKFNLSCSPINTKQLPRSITTLYIPKTVKCLTLLGFTDPLELKGVLLNNTLPNLTDLTINVPHRPKEREGANLLYQILSHVRHTVKTLQFADFAISNFKRWNNNIAQLELPEMICLRRLLIHNVNCELADDVQNLQKCFPRLTEISLEPVTCDMFRKWTEHSRFDGVDKLSLEIYYEESYRDTDKVFNLEMAQSLNCAFPNISALEVTTGITLEVETGFKFLMEKMTHLERLSVRGTKVGPNQEVPFWDGNFEEAPVQWVTFPGSRFKWEALHFATSGDTPPSISMFGLNELYLYNCRCDLSRW